MVPQEEVDFPKNTRSRLIRWLEFPILFCVKILAIMMTLVIIWSVIDVGLILYREFVSPPYSLLNVENILKIFGAFLVVLIAIEIFINIILYLKENTPHLKLVVATALMAISRKVIILDYEKIHYTHLIAIGFVIMALGITYWLLPNNVTKIKPSSANDALPHSSDQ